MFCDKEKTAAAPVPAATVVLLREEREGFSVYLMRRAGKGGSFSGAFVFPGGLAEPADRVAARPGAGPEEKGFSPAEALNEPGLDEASARGLFLAAIRETFEESGVLLASREDGSAFVPGPDLASDRLARLRKDVAAGELSLDGLARELSVSLRPDWLTPFARWITPVTEHRRWDTRFFLARFPRGQSAAPDCRELTEGLWLSPAEALARSGEGRLLLFPPTFVTLYALARRRRVSDVLEWAAKAPVRPVVPQSFCDNRGVGVILPGDPEFLGAAGPPEPGLPTRMLLTGKGFAPLFAE